MEPSVLWSLLASLALVLANAFFVASEFAIVKVRPTRLQTLVKAGDRRAATALRISHAMDAYLSANQLGVTLSSLALGWLGEPAFASLLRPLFAGLPFSVAITHTVATVFAFLAITFLHTVAGELAPKSLAIQRAETTALVCARPLHWFYILFYPFIRVLNGGARLLLRLVGMRPVSEHADAHSAEELRLVVAASHVHGILDESIATLIEHALDFRKRSVRTVMTPRPELLALDVNTKIEDAVRLTVESGYSRFPVVSQAQGRDRLIGFLHSKDLYAHVTGVRPIQTLRQIVREPILVPETMSLDRLRRLMQRRRVHVAFVLDEYANFVGMASLEDLLEELVGPIEDEQDEPAQQDVVRRPDGSVEVEGAMALSDAERIFTFLDAEPIAGIDTLGGYVFALLEHPPKPGDVVRIGRGHEAEVLAVEHFRVRRLLLRQVEPAPVEQAEAASAGE